MCNFFYESVPWDYRAAELGSPLNLTTTFIDFFSKYGVIYNKREATENMVSFMRKKNFKNNFRVIEHNFDIFVFLK